MQSKKKQGLYLGNAVLKSPEKKLWVEKPFACIFG